MEPRERTRSELRRSISEDTSREILAYREIFPQRDEVC